MLDQIPEKPRSSLAIVLIFGVRHTSDLSDGSDEDFLGSMDDMHAEMAEMNSEMLQNAAEGLCISLLEPARILAHEPDWGPSRDTRSKALLKCAAALPKPSWFSSTVIR